MGKVSVPANINYPERGAAVQQYRWKAVDSSGVSRSGVYSAASEFEAAAFVRSNWLFNPFAAGKASKCHGKKAGAV